MLLTRWNICANLAQQMHQPSVWCVVTGELSTSVTYLQFCHVAAWTATRYSEASGHCYRTSLRNRQNDLGTHAVCTPWLFSRTLDLALIRRRIFNLRFWASETVKRCQRHVRLSLCVCACPYHSSVPVVSTLHSMPITDGISPNFCQYCILEHEITD